MSDTRGSPRGCLISTGCGSGHRTTRPRATTEQLRLQNEAVTQQLEEAEAEAGRLQAALREAQGAARAAAEKGESWKAEAGRMRRKVEGMKEAVQEATQVGACPDHCPAGHGSLCSAAHASLSIHLGPQERERLRGECEAARREATEVAAMLRAESGDPASAGRARARVTAAEQEVAELRAQLHRAEVAKTKVGRIAADVSRTYDCLHREERGRGTASDVQNMVSGSTGGQRCRLGGGQGAGEVGPTSPCQ